MYNFDSLFQEFLTKTGPDAIFGPPTIDGFIDQTYALIDDATDDGLPVNPQWTYIIQYYTDNYAS